MRKLIAKKYLYLVSYTFITEEGQAGIGSKIMTRDIKLKTIDDYLDLAETITKEDDIPNIVITNIVLLHRKWSFLRKG